MKSRKHQACTDFSFTLWPLPLNLFPEPGIGDVGRRSVSRGRGGGHHSSEPRPSGARGAAAGLRWFSRRQGAAWFSDARRPRPLTGEAPSGRPGRGASLRPADQRDARGQARSLGAEQSDRNSSVGASRAPERSFPAHRERPALPSPAHRLPFPWGWGWASCPLPG